MNKKVKVVVSILVIILLIVGVIIGIVLFNKNNQNNQNQAIVDSDETEIIGETTDKILDLEQNNIEGKYSSIQINDSETAKKSIEDVKEQIGIKSIDEELITSRANTTGKYMNTFRFKQMYKGIEVYSGELIVYTDKQGNAEGIISKYNQIPTEFDINPVNSDEELKEIVLKVVDQEDAKIKESKLIIYYLGNQEYILAHQFIIESEQGEIDVIVNDKTKEVVDYTTRISTMDTLNITQEELDGFVLDSYNAHTYALRDKDRHLEVKYQNSESKRLENYMWSINDIIRNANNIEIKRDDINFKLGYDTLKTAQNTYDYYKTKFNLNSVKGDEECWVSIVTGANVIRNVDYSDNAFWDFNNMIVFGEDNIFNYDIESTSHEYMHGIFQYKLETKNEKDFGRLIIEEAYGDIFGMCAESYYAGTSNIDGIMNKISRNIKDATLTYNDLPKSYKEFKKAKNKGQDEHYYSVIISKVAYLMSEYLTINELEELWYNSIDLLTDRDVTINNCYYAVVRTSQELGFSEEKQNAIKESFESVGYPVITIYDETTENQEENNTEENMTNEIEDNVNNQENNNINENDSTSLNEQNLNSNVNTNRDSNQNGESNTGTLTKEQALEIIRRNYNEWKGLKLSQEYHCKVKDRSGNEYYAINTFSPENYMYHGGEWLEEVETGKFYAGTYYVACKYSNNSVKVGKNQRDWEKYNEGDTAGYFTQTFYLEVK